MTKKPKNLVSPVNEELVADVPSVLTHPAFGIYRGTDGRMYIAKVMYNPLTSECGNLQTIGDGDDRSTVNERFKIEIGRTNILG